MPMIQESLAAVACAVVVAVACIANLMFGWGAQAAVSAGVLVATVAVLIAVGVRGFLPVGPRHRPSH